MSLNILRIFFLILCTLGGYAVSQVRPDLVSHSLVGVLVGFGLGLLLIGVDHGLKGFSLRAFSAATFGLFLGTVIAWMIDASRLFIWADDNQQWIIRLCSFVGFGYIGMVLAMRSNKEDFSLILPYVRFTTHNLPDTLLLLDTSTIIDGRIAYLLEGGFLDGVVVIPRFVLKELQTIADSEDAIKRERGRRGLDMLTQLQRDRRFEVKIHEGDFPEEQGVDAKLVRLARNLSAKLFTNDHNLSRIAELQSIPCINLHELSHALKPGIVPGDSLHVKIVREGKEKGQGLGYLPDGTMVVVNRGGAHIDQPCQVLVSRLVQTGAGVIVFAELDTVTQSTVE